MECVVIIINLIYREKKRIRGIDKQIIETPSYPIDICQFLSQKVSE
jgi:hypothetical protein